MKIINTPIEDLIVLEPTVFQDERGYFFESYNQEVFNKLVSPVNFLQDNESLSQKGTLRGLHFQKPPFSQGKLVRVIRGSVIDIAVDIRNGSPTYGRHFSIVLSAQNHLIFWIPDGFAHGFIALEDNTLFSYKCTNVYDKASEGGILYSDPALEIDWKLDELIISDKDLVLPLLQDIESPFNLKQPEFY